MVKQFNPPLNPLYFGVFFDNSIRVIFHSNILTA